MVMGDGSIRLLAGSRIIMVLYDSLVVLNMHARRNAAPSSQIYRRASCQARLPGAACMLGLGSRNVVLVGVLDVDLMRVLGYFVTVLVEGCSHKMQKTKRGVCGLWARSIGVFG